jgi:hypothetical protein
MRTKRSRQAPSRRWHAPQIDLTAVQERRKRWSVRAAAP